MKRYLIVTEANEKIASGHLYESIVLYKEFLRKGVDAFFLVNEDVPGSLKEQLDSKTVFCGPNIQKEADYISRFAKQEHITHIIFNLRDIQNDFILCLRSKMEKIIIVCIDEFGHKLLDADIIINPMIDSDYWNYDTSKAQLFCGMEYLILSPMLGNYHSCNKVCYENPRRILISMGGVDIFGTTLKAVKWILCHYQDVEINVVLGGGFKYGKELMTLIDKYENVHVFRNIDYIYELFFISDIAICAGGNTLHELAAIGTPALIIPTMPHEVKNGEAFSEYGFGITCSITTDITEKEFITKFDMLLPYETRYIQSMNGKKISDGLGYKRVGKIVDRLVEEYAVKTEEKEKE